MLIRIIIEERPSPNREPYLFRSPLIDERIGWAALLDSAVVHLLVLMLTWVAGSYLAGLGNYSVNWAANNKVEPLRLLIPEPLYFRPAGAEARAPDPRPVRRRSDRPAAGNREASASGASGRRRLAIPPQLELPQVPQTADAGPLVLQPDYPVPPPLKTAVPALAFWARQAPLPKPPRRAIVIPGRVEAPAAPSALDAPPVLTAPNRELAASDINMALPPGQTLPVLPVPNSATNPIRLRAPAAEPTVASFDPTLGRPVNVLALGSERAPAGELVEIAKGLRNVPAIEVADGTSGARMQTAQAAADSGRAGDGRQHPNGTDTTTREVARAKAAVAPASAPGQGAGPRQPPGSGNAPGAGPAQASVAAGRAGAGAHPAALPGSPGAAPPTATNAGDVMRILHPATGSFDVVIMQSGARDDLPELGGMLSGSPVYTVYLRVGAAREWLLEYCVIPVAKRSASPYQINVGDSVEVSPPYPLSTVVPNSILGQQHSRPIVVHGLLTTSGNLRDVRAADASSLLARQLLPLLGEWRFRPALKNREAIEVEVLLVVPPNS